MRIDFYPIRNFSWVAAGVTIVGAGVGLYKTLHASHQEKVARRDAANAKLPFYQIQDEYYQNKNLAASQAQGGFSQSAKDLYTNESERGYGSGVQGILDAGGTPNDIAKLNDSFNRSLFNVSAADAQAQMQNIQYFMKANSDLSDQKTIQFLVNKKQPYENLMAQLNQKQLAEQQNFNQGLSDTVGSLGAAATIYSNANLGKGGSGGDDRSAFRPDPYNGATAPIGSSMDKSYLNERSIGNSSPSLNVFRNSESGSDLSSLSDTDRLQLISSLLKSNVA